MVVSLHVTVANRKDSFVLYTIIVSEVLVVPVLISHGSGCDLYLRTIMAVAGLKVRLLALSQL